MLVSSLDSQYKEPDMTTPWYLIHQVSPGMYKDSYSPPPSKIFKFHFIIGEEKGCGKISN